MSLERRLQRLEEQVRNAPPTEADWSLIRSLRTHMLSHREIRERLIALSGDGLSRADDESLNADLRMIQDCLIENQPCKLCGELIERLT